MRIALHPITGCGLILLFALLGFHTRQALPPASAQDKSAPADLQLEAFQRSYTAETNRNYDEAISALQAIPTGSQDYLVNLRLGWLNYLAGKYAASAKQYDAAAQIQTGSVEAHTNALLPLLAGKNYADVERVCRQTLRLDPQNYYANLRLTYVYRLQNKLIQAERINQQMVALYPTDRDWLIETALTLSALRKAEEARGYYTQVLLVSPYDQIAKRAVTSTRAMELLTEALTKSYAAEASLKYDEAISAISALKTTKSQEYLVQVRLGWLYYLSGDYDNSLKAYDKACKSNPKSIEPLLGLTLPLLAQKKFDECEQTALRAVKLAGNNYFANLRLSYALRLQGKAAEAEKINAQMLKLYPCDVAFLLEQSLVLADLKRPTEAAEYARKAALLTPTKPEASSTTAID